MSSRDRDRDEEDDRPRRRDRDDDERGSRRDRDEEDAPRHSSSKGGERKRFEYKGRSQAALAKREQGGMYDQITKGKFSSFQPKVGDFCVRICPPPSELAEEWQNYGLDIYVHYGVGVDNNRYLCPAKMSQGKESCAVCEEYAQAKAEGDDKYARECRATKRVACWVIDRDNEDKGPQFWAMPQTLDMDIAKLSYSKRSGETLMVDDPENGHDIEFTIKKSGQKTEYIGVKIASRPTPLSDNEKRMGKWLDFVQDNAISEVLNQYDSEYIEKVLKGGKSRAAKKDESADEDEDRPRTRTRSREDAKDEGRRRSKDDDSVDEDKPRARRSQDEDDEDEKPRRSKAPIDDDEEDLDEEKPAARKRDRDDDSVDEDKPRRRPRDDDDDDDEKPRQSRERVRPSRDDDDEDEDKPSVKDRIRSGMRDR